jgi:DNA-binding NarL/FixJ family response regulator
VASNPVLVSMPRASSSVTVEAKAGSVPHSAASFRADASEHQQSNLRAFPVSAQSRKPPTPFGLSERQVEAVYLTEYTNKEIAYLMDCTSRTVQSHLRLAFGRMGVHSRTAAYRALINAMEGRESGEGRMERAA